MVQKIFTAIFVVVIILTLSFVFTKTSAQEETDLAKLSSKLDLVLKNQTQIMTKLSAMEKELYIIKIRASRR